MAYNDDSVLARLSALNESHDSIATAAQWIMFHRRHADRTVQLWMQRLKDSSSTKRLSLVYLANEVAQQSRIRHKEDFIVAFSPIIAEATSVAYKGAPAEIQAKLRRVVDVWKDRSIFEAPIQEAIESRLGELDKARAPAKPGFGGSPFGASSAAVPAEFSSLITHYQAVAKLSGPLKGTVTSASQEYEKQMDPATAVPSAPVYAARLNGLLKTLASAESAVAECVKARESLISGLEKMLNANRAALEDDRQAVTQLLSRKHEIEEKKQQVELAIMRALGPADGNGSPVEGEAGNQSGEPDRPEMEALTPPAVEAFTPPAMEVEPATAEAEAEATVAVEGEEQEDEEGEEGGGRGGREDVADAEVKGDAMNVSEDKPTLRVTPEKRRSTAPGIEMLSNLASSYQSLPVSTNGSNKRRRVDSGDDFPNLGGDEDGIDDEVAEMLKGNGAF